MDELKPCPFCGGTAEVINLVENFKRIIGVEYRGCGADIVTFPDSYKPEPVEVTIRDAVARWNRRDGE